MTSKTQRAEWANPTRELILTAAERLFAEHGVIAVSNRQISEAAGQGNNTAVGYHFGTKLDLVRAVLRRHTTPIDELRQRLLTELGDQPDLRGWISCLVSPVAEHLAMVGSPSWFARFSAQVVTDPVLRSISDEESLASPTLPRVIEGLTDCLDDLPAEVRAERGDMTRQLLVHTFADRERALADGTPTPRDSWYDAAEGLIDALVGLWTAPVTNRQPR